MALPMASPSPSVSNLRKLREEAGLSMEALARRADVSTATIARLEIRGGMPTLSTAMKIAAALEVTVASIWPASADY